MPTRQTKTISLTPEQARFIDERVSSGQYQSASEVIRDALRLFQQAELTRTQSVAEIRARIAQGLDEAKRGELIDGKEAIENVRKRRRSKKDS